MAQWRQCTDTVTVTVSLTVTFVLVSVSVSVAANRDGGERVAEPEGERVGRNELRGRGDQVG